MITVEEWIKEWRNISDADEKKAHIDKISDEMAENTEIKKIKAWWDVRYFYADKAKKRLGDNFVWIMLGLSNQYNNKVGQKEFIRIYNKAFDNKEAEYAASLGLEELEYNLLEAANLYITTLGEPSPILGIIPRKDKSPKDKQTRIEKSIVEGHLQTAWVVSEGLEYIPLIAKTIVKAANQQISSSVDSFNEEVVQVKNAEFAKWFNDLDLDVE